MIPAGVLTYIFADQKGRDFGFRPFCLFFRGMHYFGCKCMCETV